jgi:DNA-binding transcriptional regulator YdaS (Cro superfamily)
MDLKTYLEPAGSASKLAAKLGIPAAMVAQWKAGSRSVPVQRCIAIEQATDGCVTCEELRPDIDWAYLSTRQSKIAA